MVEVESIALGSLKEMLHGLNDCLLHLFLLAYLSDSLSYRHCKQAADLPAKMAKRIGCAYKRDFCVVDCSLEIGWSPIFVKILGHNSWS